MAVFELTGGQAAITDHEPMGDAEQFGVRERGGDGRIPVAARRKHGRVAAARVGR